jgi:hypothetical protein
MLTKMATVLSFAIFVAFFSWQMWIASVQPHDREATSHRAQNAAKETAPQSADERLALYTEWLAAFTGLLTVVSAVQGIFLFRADRTARIAAEAARDTAIKIGLTAELAEKQMLLYGRQTDIIEKQHAIGRMQFIATHRPLLRVRYFVRMPAADGQIVVRLTIANVGSSQARLQKSGGLACLVPPTTVPLPPYGDLMQIMDPTTFEPGAAFPGTITGVEDRTRGVILRVYGYLSYADILDNIRTTAFCRHLNTSLSRFEIVNDPDLEYED